MVNEVTLGQIFIQVFPLPPISITPPVLHTYSVIHHMLANGFVAKQHLKIYNSCLHFELLTVVYSSRLQGRHVSIVALTYIARRRVGQYEYSQMVNTPPMLVDR
jgi:hypothetical protein